MRNTECDVLKSARNTNMYRHGFSEGQEIWIGKWHSHIHLFQSPWLLHSNHGWNSLLHLLSLTSPTELVSVHYSNIMNSLMSWTEQHWSGMLCNFLEGQWARFEKDLRSVFNFDSVVAINMEKYYSNCQVNFCLLETSSLFYSSRSLNLMQQSKFC